MRRLGYNKPFLLDAHADGLVDLSFSSILIEAENKLYLYLFACTRSDRGNKLLVKRTRTNYYRHYTPALEKNEVIGSIVPNGVMLTDRQQMGLLLGVSKQITQGSIRSLIKQNG